METFVAEIKDILLKYHYPSIEMTNQEEFLDIFRSSNRYFLLSWIMKQLEGCFDLLEGDDSEDNRNILEEYFYGLGFCTEEESPIFIRGTLDPLTEIKIIYKILKYVEKRNTTSLSPIYRPITTLNDYENLEMKDLNLFPMFGEIKVADSTREKPDMKEEVCQSALPTNFSSSVSHAEISDCIKNLSDNIPNIRRLGDSVVEPTHCPKLDKEVLHRCCQNVKIISQYLEDVSTVDDFLKFEEGANDEHQESTKDLKEMSEMLMNSVLNSLKDDQ